MIDKWDDNQLKFDLGDELNDSGIDGDEAVLRRIGPEEAAKISYQARQALEKMLDEPGTRREGKTHWLREYEKLIQMGWPWRVATYIAWAATPKDLRWPETLNDLATKVLGLTSARTVHHWRQKYPTINQVVAMMQASVLWEHRADVLHALAKMAKEADYKAFNDRKLFLEMTGDYVPRSQLAVRDARAKDVEGMTDAELRAWVGDEGASGPASTSPASTSSGQRSADDEEDAE